MNINLEKEGRRLLKDKVGIQNSVIGEVKKDMLKRKEVKDE